MKKPIVIICGCLFTLATFAQVKFTIPTPSDLQKYQAAAWQWNGAYIILISYAKSLGQSVEDTGTAVGEMVAATWNKESGFDGLVNSMLYIWVTMTPSGNVEISDQSEDKVVFLVKEFYTPIKEGLKQYKVTPEELSKFYELYAGKIAEHLGAEYSVKDTEEGIEVTIGKK